MAKGKLQYFPMSDMENAELFAKLHQDQLRFDHTRKKWFVWHKHRWILDSDGQVHRMAREATRKLRSQAKLVDDEELRAKKWVGKSQSRQGLESMLVLAQSEKALAIDGSCWDAEPCLLGVGNGVVDLRTGTLRNGRPEDNLSLHTEIKFDPESPCPRWTQFLEEVFYGDRALIDYIHRAVGYSLTGDTSEQSWFVLHGTGANGKSVFLDSIKATAGAYAINMPFSVLERKAYPSIPNDLAMLKGRRMVLSSEVNEENFLDAGRVKTLTGCDPITARFLYGEFFTFVPVAKFWLAVNHLPKVLDTSHGFWRRIKVIPFSRQFAAQEIDKTLFHKLRSEALGILAWAVRGCLEWKARGLGDVPKVVAQATGCYLQESDVVGEFLDQCCITDEKASVPVAVLHQAFVEWCSESGDRFPLTQIQFGRRLDAKGFVRAKKGHLGTRSWLGIDLRGIAVDEATLAGAGANSPIVVQ
jgi:putative DNA primase/helicase